MMLPTETVGNPRLESEYLASCILHGNINDPSWLDLRMNLASLKFIDASQTLLDIVGQIQKMVIGTFGLIDKQTVKLYYYGKADELHELLLKLDAELSNLSLTYNTAIPEKYMNTLFSMAQDTENAPMTFEDVGEQVNKYQSQNDELLQLDNTLQNLRKMQGTVQAILRIYKEDNPKLTNKEIPAKLSPEYKIFLNDLSYNLDVATHNPQISMVVGKGLDAIISTLPKDDLDPYLEDVCNNLIEALTAPKDYYNMCQRDDVISSSVGAMFGHCYPEFYMKYVDMYMDDYEKMDFQNQIDFRKCFALDADDSELTALCSKYVKLGFVQQ